MDRPSGLETRITLDLAHTIWPIRFGPYDLAHTIWPIRFGKDLARGGYLRAR
jgi:hypothetical protein